MYICIWKSCVQRWSLPYLSGLLFDLFFSSKEEEGDGGSVANGGDHYVSVVPPIFTMRDFLLLYHRREKLLTVQSLLSAALYIDRSIWGTYVSSSLSFALCPHCSPKNPSGLFIFLFFPVSIVWSRNDFVSCSSNRLQYSPPFKVKQGRRAHDSRSLMVGELSVVCLLLLLFFTRGLWY